MATNKPRHAYQPDYAVAPGRTLQETIDHLGIDQQELAKRTGLAKKTVNQIIKGKAPLTQETALLLERVTKIPARIWNNLECNYREQIARIEARKQLEQDSTWLRHVPTRELIKRGVLPQTGDTVELLDRTLKFFGVANVEAWREGWSDGQFAFRKSHQASEMDGKLATWLRLAEIQAQERTVDRFNKSQFSQAVKEIRGMTVKKPSEFVPDVTRLCASAGVVFCLVPEIPGGKISGAAKWLSSDKALIALNLRGKTNDLFWFTFFHEAGHLLNDSKKETYVDVGYSDDPREKAANRFARTTLIPEKHEAALPSLRRRADVLRFAERLGIAPGIVVGRLQHEQIIRYNQLNDLKQKFAWVA